MKQGRLKNIAMLIIVVLMISYPVYGEIRSIYIGDIVTLDITGDDITEDEILSELIEYEVISVDSISDGYRVSFRGFEPGKDSLKIGDVEIEVNIASMIDDDSRNDIYEADISPRGSKTVYPVKWILACLGVLCIASFSVIVARYQSKRKYDVTGIKRFNKKLGSIELVNGCLVDMTLIFKDYIGEKYGRRIIGKTSKEIMAELKLYNICETNLKDISNWLRTCERYKYSMVKPEIQDFQIMKNKIAIIAKNVERESEASK